VYACDFVCDPYVCVVHAGDAQCLAHAWNAALLFNGGKQFQVCNVHIICACLWVRYMGLYLCPAFACEHFCTQPFWCVCVCVCVCSNHAMLCAGIRKACKPAETYLVKIFGSLCLISFACGSLHKDWCSV